MAKLIELNLPKPFASQADFVYSKKNRIIAMAGRRGGKTSGLGIRSSLKFLEGKRILYGAPTADQSNRFWTTVNKSLQPMIDEGVVTKHSQMRMLTNQHTGATIWVKTAWVPDMLRGDYADELILDEFQMQDPAIWESVGQPMLLDTNGTAVICFTPPTPFSKGIRARDKQHSIKLYRQMKRKSEWDVFNFSSYDNPYLSRDALDQLKQEMHPLSYRLEILAEDVTQMPGALWSRELLAKCYLLDNHPTTYERIVIGVDPSGGAHDEVGIFVCGKIGQMYYCIEDLSTKSLSPNAWAKVIIETYYRHKADRVVIEKNFGGDMVEALIHSIDNSVSTKNVFSSRNKIIRAEPIASLYERMMVKHLMPFDILEDQLCTYELDASWSPDRMDAMVFAMTELSTPHQPYVFA